MAVSSITEVSSDEAENAPGNPDGNTTRDIVIASDCKSTQLRIERDTRGNGRVYTLQLTVRDASGNQAERSAKLLVPRPRGAGQNDGGPVYTVASTCH